MIWAPDPRRLLDHFADFSEAITKLHGALNVLGDNLGDAEREANNRARVLAQWELTDLKGRILLNALWQAARWRQRMYVPDSARGIEVDDAFRDQDAIGPWRYRIPPIAEA